MVYQVESRLRGFYKTGEALAEMGRTMKKILKHCYNLERLVLDGFRVANHDADAFPATDVLGGPLKPRNVRPCVARRTPSRDKPTIRTFEVSPSQVFETWSICHYSIAISPPGHLSATKITAVIVVLSVVRLTLSITASAVPPCDQLRIFGFRNPSIIVS